MTRFMENMVIRSGPPCFAALFAALVIVTSTRPLYAQTVNPVAHWTFDEGTSLVANDSSGNGNRGIVEGRTLWSAGVVGPHALSFSGSADSYVDVTNTVVDTAQSYTVTAWVRLNQITGYQTFVSIDGSQVSGFFLQLRDDTGVFALTVLPGDAPGDATVAAASEAPDPGVWYHLTGVHDAAAQTLSLYVNGKLQQTVPFRMPWHAGGHTEIGRGRYEGNPVDFVNGQIDDVRFYNVALSAKDVAAISAPYLAAIAPAPHDVNAPTPVLQIDAGQIKAHVSPMLYGLMTEEINHSYDGGLYGELIQNRIFRDTPDSPAHWTVVQGGGGTGSIALDRDQPINTALTTCLRLNAASVKEGQRVGIANDGYWGVPVTPGARYRASFYAKASSGFTGPLTVDIESLDGATVYAHATVPRVTAQWRQYTVTLSTGKASLSAANRFVISTAHPGSVWFNLVSLFPKTWNGRPNGNRIDLMQKLLDMKPTFLRLPGGNYLEGDTIATRFEWKNTVHGLDQRPGHPGPWGYRSSDGLGLLEFLEWCEDLHVQPVLAVYAGYSLGGEHIAAGPDLQPYVQDALDEIEYATGDPATPWGLQRARDGHPKPFKIEYVEIGNEDWFDRSKSYDGRYTQFHDAIKARYPGLKLIATTGVSSRTPDVYDEHYYLSPRAFERDVHRYDSYSRTGTKVFVGEWASQEGKPTPDLNSALGDAAWMTGMERNSDVVIMSCYAPLFVNVNEEAQQWGTNLIGYNALTSYGSPSYYAQVMFGSYLGDVVPSSTLSGATRLAYSVTRDSNRGTIYLKVVNPTSAAQPVRIDLSGVRSIASNGRVVLLTSASPKDTNTISEPTRIVPIVTPLTGASRAFEYRFLPYSITILQIQAK